jgi:hypothetical protein
MKPGRCFAMLCTSETSRPPFATKPSFANDEQSCMRRPHFIGECCQRRDTRERPHRVERRTYNVIGHEMQSPNSAGAIDIGTFDCFLLGISFQI